MFKKYLSSLLVVVLCSTSLFAKNNCTIKGTIIDSTNGTVLIRNLQNSKLDTVKFANGKFVYACELAEPTPFLLTNEANQYQLFFAEPNSTINISLKRKSMQVTFLDGSKAHEIFRKLVATNEPIQQFAAQVQQGFQNPNLNRDSLTYVMNAVNGELKKNFFNFLKENKTSEVASFIVFNTVSSDKNINVKSADTMYQQLEGKALTCFYGKELTKFLNKMKSVEVGYQAPDFTLADSTGNKKYTLSKVYSQNKYTLIDFWASWCGPCKGEIPFLKTAYEQFHKKGFEIISVSLDDKKPNWLAALRQFQMPWIQISDVKGFSSAVNELYHVPSIPKTLLLDKTGKIVATDLRGNALDLKLEELLGK